MSSWDSGESGPSTGNDLLVGEVLYEQYEIRALVGRGGMGTVYRVRDWDWNVDLAVKVPSPHLISNWVAKERFVLEAQTWIELGVHPNIVQCWFVREHAGLPLVFMDYLPQGSLRELRKGGHIRPGDWKTILDLLIQACSGLGYAHEQGLVHRDVKPANLLLREGNRLCVTDFGLVKVTQLDESQASPPPDFSSRQLAPAALLATAERDPAREESLLSSLTLTGTGTLLGTPEYGAPEQWDASGRVGPPADIYALGGILFELCAGRRPFDDGVKRVSTAMILGDHLMKPAPDPRTFNPEISPALSDVILRCLAKNPQQRPESMNHLREELEGLFRDLTGSAYPRAAPRAGAQRADALNNKAVSLWNLGFDQKAFDAWREASKLDGLHPETVYNRTMIQWRLAQIDDQEAVRRLTQVKAAYPHLGTYLGYFYLDQGVPYLAEQELLAALQHSMAARWGTVWRALGDAQMYLEEYPKAVESYRQALQRMPDDREARARLTMAEQGLRQVDDRIRFPRTRPRLQIERRGPIGAVALSPDGSAAFHWCDGALEMWNTADGSSQWIWRDEAGTGSSPTRLSVDRDWVLSLDSPHGRCWSRAHGQLRLELEGRKRFLVSYGGRSPEEGPQRSWALVGGEVLEQVDLPTGNLMQALEGHTKPILCAAVSRDGLWAMTGSGDRSVRLWDLAQGRCLHVMEGHTDLVESVALSPDGATALSGGRDKTVRVWHVATGDCLFVLQHDQDVRRIRLSSDGRYALVGSWNLGEKDYLDCWEVATGQRLFSRPGGHWVSPYQTGPWALVASKTARPGPLTLWELPSGRALSQLEEHPTEVSGFALSRNDRWALTGCFDGSLRFWEVDWEARVGSFSLVVNRTPDHDEMESTYQQFSEHLEQARKRYQAEDSVGAYQSLRSAREVAGYTRDPGALLLNGLLMQRFARKGLKSVWQLRSFSSEGHVSAVQFSQTGTHALSASGKILYLWELASGSCVRGFTGHSDGVKGVAVSYDAQRAASASLDGTLRIWNLHSGECQHVIKLVEPLLDVCLDRSGLLVAVSAHRIYTCDLDRPDRLHSRASGPIDCLAISPEGGVALTGAEQPDTLVLWPLPAATPTRPWKAGPGLGAGSATALALSGDGRYALSGDHHGFLRVLDLQEGSCKLHWAAHEQAIRCVCLSYDGRVAVSAGDDGTLYCWDVASGRCWDSLSGQGGALGALALSPDARFVLSVGADRALRYWELDWDLDSAQEARTLTEVWKKTSVLERLGLSGFFRKKS